MRTLATSALVLGAAVAVPLLVSPAAASASTIAAWEMNEGAGHGGTMTDSSGNRITGDIGDLVQRHEIRSDGRIGYRFLKAYDHTAGADRLVTVADRRALDPRSRTYSFSVAFRTGRADQNILQKGQSNTTGGFFKLDMSKGIAYCTFKGADGQRGIGSGVALNDTKRHVVKCTRDAKGVAITVDSRPTRRLDGPTGSISNATALTIGGKKYCNETTVGCDFFVGVIDRVKISAS